MSTAARGSGFPFSSPSQSTSSSGDRGICIFPRGLHSMELPRGTALVSNIIALLHFADDPMEQAGSDHFVLPQLRRDIFEKRIALRRSYRSGSFHQPLELVSGQP